jgi:hypothetical protein
MEESQPSINQMKAIIYNLQLENLEFKELIVKLKMDNLKLEKENLKLRRGNNPIPQIGIIIS